MNILVLLGIILSILNIYFFIGFGVLFLCDFIRDEKFKIKILEEIEAETVQTAEGD